MGSILIRNIDDALKARLRVRAAERGHSMEAEAREILSLELEPPTGKTRAKPKNLAELAQELFGPDRGVELELHPRAEIRTPPDFSE